MSSSNEEERKCRKRKPVTCRYCDDCKSKSLIQMHDSIISSPNSNYETDKKVPKYRMGDDVHANNASSETRCQDIQPFSCENKHILKVFKKEPADDDCPLNQESRVHNDDGAENVFNCGECTLTFGHEYLLLMHVSSVHGTKEESTANFICEECGKLFAQEFTLRVHSLCAHEGGMCGTGNELIEMSKLQLWEVGAGEKYELFKCNECGAIVKTKWNFRRHLVKSHNDEKPFCCAKCGKTFKQRHHLRAHFKKELHHLEIVEPGVRSVSTLVRCKVEENPSESVVSEKPRKKLSPPSGDKTYFKGWSVTGGVDIDNKPSISELNIHGTSSSTVAPVYDAISAVAVTIKVEGGKSATSSLNSDDDDVTDQILKVNVCPPCGKSFDEYEKLIEHAKICAKYALLVKREKRRVSKMGLTKREYGCSVCGSTFSHAIDINAHLDEVHDTKFFFHKCAKYPCGEKFRF